ncbi:hypothetical protein [Caballeronia calidae]|uniref:hypothetical protein n=1 Tax=Caballeronia calidae TaxID=1777139 RepID=UPI0012FE6225|nr:hypothetical protein [Caballeronia calidae]
MDLLAQTLKRYPGVLLVVANDWPLASSIDVVRTELTRLRPRVADVLDRGRREKTREEAIFEHAAEKDAAFAILSSPEFAFTARTVNVRVNVTEETGFDSEAADKLEVMLSSFGEQATSYITLQEFRQSTFYENPRHLGKDFTSLYIGYSIASLMGLQKRSGA